MEPAIDFRRLELKWLATSLPGTGPRSHCNDWMGKQILVLKYLERRAHALNLLFHFCHCLFLLTLIILFFAEQSNAQSEPASSDAVVERIQVTGSHIKRIQIEGPSPITVIGSESFVQSGNITLEDMLRDSPYFESVQSSGDGRTGYFRFRGQHAGNTLVLLNGMRLPREEGTFFTSISYLPTSAIDRIELLRDGGSATYGADAMAGVVNFITKRDVSGGEFSTSFSAAESGLGFEQNYQMGYGGQLGRRGTYLVGTQYRQMNAVTEAQAGGFVRESSQVFPSGQGRTSYRVQTQGNDDARFGVSGCEGSICTENPLLDRAFQPASEDIGGLLTINYPISASTEVSFLTIVSRKNQLRQAEARRFELEGVSPSAFRTPSALGPQDFSEARVNGYSREIMGPDERQRIADTASLQAQVSRDFGSTWNLSWQNAYNLQMVNETAVRGNINTDRLRGFANRGLLQFDDVNSMNMGLAASLSDPTRRYIGNAMNSRLVTGGELLQLGRFGIFSMAIGSDFEFETMAYNHDEEITRGASSSFFQQENFTAQRQVVSAFSEFTYTNSSFELQAAGRFDQYDQFGSTFNPKFGIRYNPTASLMLRGSWGTGFKPPGLVDMASPTFTRFEQYRDYNRCAANGQFGANCRGRELEVNVVQNPLASFETSTHSSFGLVWQPADSFDLSIDQWNFAGRGTISNFTTRHLFDFESAGGRIEDLAQFGLAVDRDPETGIVRSVTLPNIYNRDAKWLNGIDVSMNVQGYLSGGLKLSGNSTVSHIFNRRERTFFDSPVLDFGEYGTQNNTSLTLAWSRHSVRTAARTLLNGTLESSRDGWDFPIYTEVDLTYTINLKELGTVALAARNIGNTRPPIDPTRSFATVASIADITSPLGRRYFVSYSNDF